MTIGQNIRRLRQANGMTQWQLSRQIGCTPGRVYLIERGDVECDKTTISAIAKALNVDEKEILR